MRFPVVFSSKQNPTFWRSWGDNRDRQYKSLPDRYFQSIGVSSLK
jgi:hypothetical protein